MQPFKLSSKYLRLIGALSACFLAVGTETLATRSQDTGSQNPTITLEIVKDDSMKPNEPYRVGQQVRVKVIAKNESSEQFTVALINVYSQNRPELFRNGKMVAYRPDIAKAMRAGEADADLVGVGKRDVIRLQPYSASTIKVINLSDWYHSLDPGSYRLTNRFRAKIGGPWSQDSKAVVFDVAR